MFLISKDFCPHDKAQCPRWLKWSLGLLVLLAALGWLAYHKIAPAPAVSTLSSSNNLSDTYQQLLQDSTSIGGNWMRTLNPALQDVKGDLIWNNVQQTGVTRFVNLPDPPKNTLYKVWIYDSRRPTNQPVLGATLSKGSERSELFAKLNVSSDQVVAEPYKFLLTQEASDGTGEPVILLMVQP